jgi:hypothetical protein
MASMTRPFDSGSGTRAIIVISPPPVAKSPASESHQLDTAKRSASV